MSKTSSQQGRMLAQYDAFSNWLKPAVRSLPHEANAVVADGRENFTRMLGELPYLDRPEHTMAGSVFACAAMLAIFEALRDRGVDPHAWGRAIHGLSAAPPPESEEERQRARADAADSQKGAAANEFIFEIVDPAEPANPADRQADDQQAGDGPRSRQMNITSCAICHLFANHDAMALVPYMCALDDLMSDAGNQGLRRTGTIALGAKRCDFRFEPGGEPLRLLDQYPEQIRLKDT